MRQFKKNPGALIIGIFYAGFAYAASSLSFWSIDCDENKNTGFAIIDEASDQYKIRLVGGFKTIPYPGLHDVVDIRNDERIIWISDTEISVSNSDPDAGWSGRKTFYNCGFL